MTTTRLALGALLLLSCATRHGRGGPGDHDVLDRTDVSTPRAPDRGVPSESSDAGRDAGAETTDQGSDAGAPITCPTQIVPEGSAVELPELSDAPTLSFAASDDGFAVLTSRRQGGILRPELWRYDVETGVGEDVDLGPLPFDGWIGSSAIVAEGSALWVALTEAGPTINRTALLRVEGEPPYAQQVFFLPRASRVSQLTPTGEPGVFDALLRNAAEPTLQAVRLSLDDGIVSGPVDLPPEGTFPDAISRLWLPSGRVLGLRRRFGSTPATLLDWPLSLDAEELGEPSTLVEWGSDAFIGTFGGVVEIDGSLLFVVSLGDLGMQAAQLYRLAPGAAEPDPVSFWPSSTVTQLAELPGGCGLAVLRSSRRVDDTRLFDFRIMLYGPDDEFITEALAIPDDHECTGLGVQMAIAPGRIGVLSSAAGCGGGVAGAELSFRWFSLR